MTGTRLEGWAGRRLFVALSALALMLQVLIPQGYMVGGDPAARGLVICTGHGPLLTFGGHGPLKAPKPHADAPCGFAAHAQTTPPPTALAVFSAPFAFDLAPTGRPYVVTPGRGMAAPPPPSQAPPARMI